MEKILIKDALIEGERSSILIEGNRIVAIGKGRKADVVIDASTMAALPGLVNTHNHAAMSLFRGYADDLMLDEWLNSHIWPLEAKMTRDDVYWGTRLACLEMIMGGTTCFNDMYWHLEGTAKAVSDSGMRGVLSSVFIDRFGNEDPSALRKRTLAQFRDIDAGTRVSLALGPHAIYTVTEEGLMWIKEYSDKHDMLMHFHLSETKKEVDDCIKAHGKRPVEYLAEIGFLGPNLVCAHCVWLSDGEMDLLAKNKVKVSHCPTSNMKLSVGGVLAYEKLRARGVSVSLGTDGCASNNSLDMFQAMKSAALLHKHSANNPTVLSAADAFNMATQEGARALKLDAGRIAEGALADIILIDLKRPEMTPLHNLTSNMVYSASGNCVDTVICDGKIIMEAKTVKMQETIMQKASQAADCLTKRK